MENEIASTILQQLGGNRFCVMTGAKNLLAGVSSLQFKVGKGNTSINYCRITLEPSDTYKMDFFSVKKGIPLLKRQFTDVYCEDLQRLFTEATGLYTSFGKMGA